MNSLTYLSRQFDVLASARTPPSTPSTETLPLLPDHENYGPLKRVSTWSTKSFVILPSGPSASSSASTSWSPLKRSYSSPADVHPGPPSPSSSSSSYTASSSRRPSLPSSSRRPSRPSSRRPSVSASDKATRSKTGPVSLLRRVVIIRIFISLWNYLYDGWKTLAQHPVWGRVQEIPVEEGSSEDEKDTEDESKDEKLLVLDDRLPPPLDPPIGPLVTPPSPVALHSPVTRALTVPIILSSEPSIFLAPTSSGSSSLTVTAIAHPSELSRTPTPTTLQRKQLLHRPKTLVLDLDETLIHSTSRPMHFSSGGNVLSSFGFGKKNKGSGYTVEVCLGGHNTVYHVYKRPFVDYFLRKVRFHQHILSHAAQLTELIGFSLVYPRNIYSLYERVRRSRH